MEFAFPLFLLRMFGGGCVGGSHYPLPGPKLFSPPPKMKIEMCEMERDGVLVIVGKLINHRIDRVHRD